MKNVILSFPYLSRILGLLITWVIVFIIVKYDESLIKRLDEASKKIEISPRDLKTINRILDYIVIFIGIIVTLNIFHLTSYLYSILTAAGIIGIIIGFAIKDIAANFISGIFIILDRPFVIGDFIKIGKFLGKVSHVSLRSTEIITLDGSKVRLPNNLLATTPIINFSVREPIRRIDFSIAVSEENDIEKVLSVLRNLVKKESKTIQEEEVQVFISDIKNYAIYVNARFYVPKEDYFEVLANFKKKVIGEFKKNSIELAAPVRKNI